MNNNEQSFVIYRWMTNLFKTKSNATDYIKRDIFAYIYNCTVNEQGWFDDSQQQLAIIVGASEQKVCSKLKELTECEYLIKNT